MERRMILAVVLSFVVVTVYSALTGRCSPPPQETPVEGTPGEGTPGEGTPGEGTPTAPDGTPPAAPAAPAPGTPAAPEPPAAPPAPADEDEAGPQRDYVPSAPRTALRSQELEVTFTSLGGAVESVRLLGSREPGRTDGMDLVVPVADDLLFGQVDATGLAPTAAPGGADRKDLPAGALRRYHWRRDEAAEAQTPESDVVYVFDTASGGRWTKRWVMPEGEGRYDLRLLISWRAPAGQTMGRAVKVLAASGLLREASTGANFLYPNQAILRTANMTSPVRGAWGLPVSEGADVYDLRMLGARTHYYLSTWYTDRGRTTTPPLIRSWATGEAADRRDAMERHLAEWFRDQRGRDVVDEAALLERIRGGVAQLHMAWLVVEVPAQAPDGTVAPERELTFYVGPIDRHTLAAPAYEPIEPVIEYQAAFDLVAKGLLGIYDIFRAIFGSAGLAVVLMTLVVRGLMMPLSIKNQLSMRTYSRKIAKIKPKLDAIKQKFGNNPRRFREEQAKLYREHGIGFPMGCLMMLIQIPIFFALFSSLRAEYTLRGESFLWIPDLSGPDRLVDLGTTLNLMVVQVSSINILPLLMVGLSIWQQRLMPKPADEQQAQQMRMMKWLPVIFAVILYNYTAALALYMVISSAMSIIEGRIVRARDAAAQTAAADATA